MAAIVILFYSNLLFTDRFSFLLDKDDANQAYAWHHFVTVNLQRGVLPLWDPNTQGGHSFIGEMQTGLFYPLKLPMYLWPLDPSGLPSVRLQHVFYVAAHILAAWSMFFLARAIGLRRFSALVASLCFSLGGFMGGPVAWGWPHLMDSGIWLPVILLFLMRSLRHPDLLRSILNACLAGLALAMVILAGGLHLAIMDALVVAGAGAVFACGAWRDRMIRAFTAVATVATVSFGASAIQLLPSMEYSAGVERYINDGLWLPATQKIPYSEILYNFPPRGAAAFLIGGAPIGLAEFSPYLGVLPFLLAIFGAWRFWRRPWTRSLTAMAVGAFLYGLGSYFPLHRILYALVPYLWMAKEPARFIYLTHLAIALLAGFGIEALGSQARLRGLRMGVIPKVLLVLLMAADWRYFNTSIQRKADAHLAGRDYLENLIGCRNLAKFLTEQPGLFRVNLAGPEAPNIGDLFGIQTVSGLGSTRSLDFKVVWQVPMAADLLNVRFFVCRTKACPAGITPVYRDGDWTAIENKEAYPRAWLVHDAVVEASPESAIRRMNGRGFDALKTAVLAETLEILPQPLQPGFVESAEIRSFEPNRLTLHLRASSRALLVLSENYSVGWHARVNGTDTPIHKADVTIRAILVPAGESRVELWYLPDSFLAGAILSCLTFTAILALGLVAVRRTRDSSAYSSLASPPAGRASPQSSGTA